VTVEDTVSWRGVTGEIVVYPDSLVSGYRDRDRTARVSVFGTYTWQQIRFHIDSLAGVQPGDTIRATVHGRFSFRGVETPTSGPLIARREAVGLRVLARLVMAPSDLIEIYGAPAQLLKLGTSTGVWHAIYFGVDVVLQASP
jgi:hypothetical protein